MSRPFDRTVVLAAPPHTRSRYMVWLENERLRAGATAAVVILVPGAWVVWLVAQLVRRGRAAVRGEG
jgi:hypothetical protein